MAQWGGPEISPILKKNLRKGIDFSERRKAWLYATGYVEFIQKDKKYFERCTKNVFGDNVPSKFHRVPLFGGSLLQGKMNLDVTQLHVVDRILCLIGHLNPDVEYCPFLPTLVAGMLTYCSEKEVFCVIHLLLKRSRDSSYYSFLTAHGYAVFCHTLMDLIASKVPSVADSIISLGVNIASFLDNWFSSMFLSIFPIEWVYRIIDVFLSEGLKILYRIPLGIMKSCRKLLSYENNQLSRQKVSQLLLDATTVLKCVVDIDALMKTSFKFHFSRNKSQALEALNSEVVHPAEYRNKLGKTYYRPNYVRESLLRQNEWHDLLWSWLPQSYQVQDYEVLFTTESDGCSLSTLFEKCKGKGSNMLVCKTVDGEVFGAFFSCAIQPTSKFVGDRDCFLFTLSPDVQHFVPSGENNHFLKSADHGIMVGTGGSDGGYGLFIDNELTGGHSEPSQTYHNPALSRKGTTFELVHVEVCTFVPSK